MTNNISIIKHASLFLIFAVTSTMVYTIDNNSNKSLPTKGIIDKILAFIATSRPICYSNKLFSQKKLLQQSRPPKEIQILAQQAQTAVGIPVKERVPVIHHPALDPAFAAIAENNAIIISNEFLDDTIAYGVKRCNMFHEAIHIKYHDKHCSQLLGICVSIITSLISINIFKYDSLPYYISLIVGCYINHATLKLFQKYYERRADLEGHYATQCYQCITEKIQTLYHSYELMNTIINQLEHKKGLNSEEKIKLAFAKQWIENKKPYLSIEENESIATNLKQNNKVCTFHKTAISV